MWRKRRGRVGHADAWGTRTRDSICASGVSTASRSHNSLFKCILPKIWVMRSHRGRDRVVSLFLKNGADAWGTRSRGRACASSTSPATIQLNFRPYIFFTSIYRARVRVGDANAWEAFFPHDADAWGTRSHGSNLCQRHASSHALA